MGRNLHTRIVYGYSIGGEDDGWQFDEYDEADYQMKWPEWVALDNGEEGDYAGPEDFISQAKDRLLVQLTGFEDSDDWMGDEATCDAYYARKHAAEKQVGVDFEVHGVGEYTEWVLGFELASSYDSVSEIDAELIATLLNPLNMTEMDYKLHEALRVLQLHPKAQATPRLLLLASYF